MGNYDGSKINKVLTPLYHLTNSDIYHNKASSTNHGYVHNTMYIPRSSRNVCYHGQKVSSLVEDQTTTPHQDTHAITHSWHRHNALTKLPRVI